MVFVYYKSVIKPQYTLLIHPEMLGVLLFRFSLDMEDTRVGLL